jgi:hypothetical protein
VMNGSSWGMDTWSCSCTCWDSTAGSVTFAVLRLSDAAEDFVVRCVVLFSSFIYVRCFYPLVVSHIRHPK